MEFEEMGAQTLSIIDKKFTIVLREASSLPTLTHISNSLKLPRATPACHDRFGLVSGLVYMIMFLSTIYIYVNTRFENLSNLKIYIK